MKTLKYSILLLLGLLFSSTIFAQNKDLSYYVNRDDLLEEFLTSFTASVHHTNDTPLEDYLYIEDKLKSSYGAYTLFTDIDEHLSWEEYQQLLLEKNELNKQLSSQLYFQFGQDVFGDIIDITELIPNEDYTVSYFNIDRNGALIFNHILLNKKTIANQTDYKIVDFITPLGKNSALDILQLDFVIEYNLSDKYKSNPIQCTYDDWKSAFETYSELYQLQDSPKQIINYYEKNANQLGPFASFAYEKYAATILSHNSIEKIDELLNASKPNNELGNLNIIIIINAYLSFSYYESEEQKQSYYKKAYDRLYNFSQENNSDVLNYQLFKVGTSPIIMNQWTSKEEKALNYYLDLAIVKPDELMFFLQMAVYHQKWDVFSKVLELTKINFKQNQFSPDDLDNYLKNTNDPLVKKIHQQIVSHPEFIAWKKESENE